MSSRARRSSVLHGVGQVALLPPAAFAVHQLRFMLAFGGDAGAELARTGHPYMHSVAPWIVLSLALGAGCFLRALGRALVGHTSLSRYTFSLTGLWVVCSVVLVAIYATQELLEGLLAVGHASGLVGVFGYGGWWAVPAALCVGLVLAAWLHGARWVLEEVARRRRPHARGTRPQTRPRLIGAVAHWRLGLAAGWSGRGPPA